jgi:hypothetical protein
MMCFRPVAAKKNEPTLVIEKLEAVADSSKQFKVDVKNTGAVVGNLLSKAFVHESSEFEDTEVPVVWSQTVINPNENSIGVIGFDWVSGKTYYVKVQTNEKTVVTKYTKAL